MLDFFLQCFTFFFCLFYKMCLWTVNYCCAAIAFDVANIYIDLIRMWPFSERTEREYGECMLQIYLLTMVAIRIDAPNKARTLKGNMRAIENRESPFKVRHHSSVCSESLCAHKMHPFNESHCSIQVRLVKQMHRDQTLLFCHLCI